MLTMEQCTPGRPVRRMVSGPNGQTKREYRGEVVKPLRTKVRVMWRSVSTAYRFGEQPTFHATGPYSSDVKPEELR